MRIKTWLLNNIGLKVLSLVMAILLWLYIAGEQEGIDLKSVIDFLRYKIEIKTQGYK
ncbi:MAG: hypothetical protein U9Q08_02670 [Candidatus Omnitrophota bacterium]|nr:hypothetical protein [Candidatus Omnitrophota bacterium]